MKKKHIIILVILAVFVLLTVHSAVSKRKDAAQHNLPLNRVKLSEISGYSLISENNTYIPYAWWGINKPIARISEFNPYDNYWIINDNQTVITNSDGACHYSTAGKIYVKGQDKLPSNFHHSDKISKISVNFHENEVNGKALEADLDLTPDEIAELEKVVFLQPGEEGYKTTNMTFPDNNQSYPLIVKCYIKDLDGLFYFTRGIRKYTDNKYYAVEGFGNEVIGEVSDEIGRKIDEAIQNNSHLSSWSQ